ncbi:MAG: SLBB domain-containing protein [Firmicutes bacterium]|nr:SLBB domain-containing protein [Bacillota bacterium]
MKTVKRFVLAAMFLIFTLALTTPAQCQIFQSEDLESLKREFMRGASRPTASARPSSDNKKDDKSSDDSTKTAASRIKFPGMDEILARSDVAFIDHDKYKLGPGDNLNVVVYGRTWEEQKVIVQPDGNVFLNPAGAVYVKGLTINQARKKIADIMAVYYRDIQLKLMITKLRTIEVRILGEVPSPGTFIVTPAIGVCDAIGMAGGLKDTSSTRNIILRNQNGKRIADIDIFAWYYKGDKFQNHELDGNYEIFVPIVRNRITVDGAFKRKGNFEYKPGERVSDLLRMVEPDVNAVLSEGKLSRVTGKGEIEVIPVNLKSIMKQETGNDGNPELADGDALFAPNIEIFLKKIRVIGELKDADQFTRTTNKITGEIEFQKLGLYNLKQGEKVKDIVIALGGITAKADEERAKIERPMPDGEFKIIPVNLRAIFNGDETQNIALQEGDTFIVPAIQDSIYIIGEVRSPGIYQYNPGNKIKEYITLAGGPTRKAILKTVKIIKERKGKLVCRNIDLRSILSGNATEDVDLRPGDVIYVPYTDLSSWRDIVAILADMVVIQRLFGW